MSNNLIPVDSNNFEKEILQSSIPVLIYFTANWCGSCKRQLPIIKKFATDNEDKIKVVKIDADDSLEILAKYGIRGIPTVILVKDGQQIGKLVGLMPPEKLSELIKNI